jgi:hypothetical protein
MPPEAARYLEAHFHAEWRIRPQRHRLTQEQAEAIAREEFRNRGVSITRSSVEHLARESLRSPYWPFLHPRLAKQEGYRFDWPWSKDSDD